MNYQETLDFKMKNIKTIQEWFKFQCNGDWEHESGIKIQTISNPGWNLNIDIIDTILEGFITEENMDNGDGDWFFIRADGKVFSGSGDINKLTTLLDKFVSFILKNIEKSNYIYTIYAEIGLSSTVRVFRPIEAKMIGISNFKIISIPEMDIKDLKVITIDDFEKIDFEKINTNVSCKIGDIVKCDLIYFYDYPSIIIL